MNSKTQNAMNKNRFMILLAGIAAVLTLAACSDDDGLVPSSAEPTIAYPYDALVADLNMADNLPVVAVVKSEAGLKRVSLSIRTADNETVPVREVTDFFDRRSYSLSEKVNYKSGYTAAVVEAVDLLDRKVETELPIRIVDVVEAPSIVFTPERIDYDETVGGEMPRTHFVVSTTAALNRIEMFRVTTSGQQDYGFPIDFTEGEQSYEFDELIQYGEFDRGFKVKATDSYGQVRITTLPVSYKTVPPPAVTLASETIFADKDEQKTVAFEAESLAGVVKVEVYRLEGKTETLVKTTPYSTPQKTLSYDETIVFTNTTTGVKVVVTDNVNRSTTVTAKAYVNLVYEEAVTMLTAPLTEGNAKYPGVYALLSLKDMRTYSLSSILGDAAAEANVDLKVYAFGSKAVLRLYSIDGGAGTKSNEFKTGNGKSVLDMTVQNETRLLKLPSKFDFDAATAQTIADNISASNITQNGINPIVVGDVIAFKTASTSSVGGDRIGVMKLVGDVQVLSNNVTARALTFSIKLPKEQ